MKRHLIFPTLALLAAVSTAAFAGWSMDPSTLVSDAIAAEAAGGGCASFGISTCGAGGTGGCSSTTCLCGGTGSTGTAKLQLYCGVESCGSVNTLGSCAG
jgi:hypothetical protein